MNPGARPLSKIMEMLAAWHVKLGAPFPEAHPRAVSLTDCPAG